MNTSWRILNLVALHWWIEYDGKGSSLISSTLKSDRDRERETSKKYSVCFLTSICWSILAECAASLLQDRILLFCCDCWLLEGVEPLNDQHSLKLSQGRSSIPKKIIKNWKTIGKQLWKWFKVIFEITFDFFENNSRKMFEWNNSLPLNWVLQYHHVLLDHWRRCGQVTFANRVGVFVISAKSSSGKECRFLTFVFIYKCTGN